MAKSGFRDRFEPVSAIEVVDRYTVRITLKEPYAPVPEPPGEPDASARSCRARPRRSSRTSTNPDAVIGTGPFVLKSYEKGVRVVFERNPDYFMKGFPYLDGVVIEITPDAAARLAVLRAGKAELPHIWGWVSPEEARGAASRPTPRWSITPLQGHRAGLHLHAHRPAAVQRHAGAARRLAGHRPQGVERRAAVRRGLRRRRAGALRAQGLEARRRQDRRRPRPSTCRATIRPRPRSCWPRPG